MDEFTICNFLDTNDLLNMEALPSDCYPPTIHQPWPHLEMGGSSTHTHLKPLNSIRLPKVVTPTPTPNIPIQDGSAKDNKSWDRHRHQQAKSSNVRHNVSQKRRRNEVKEKMKLLKDLIPKCDKKDMVSVLDGTIKYMQSLKAQAQWYSWYQHQLQYSKGVVGNIVPLPMINPRATGLIPYIHYQAPTTTMVRPNPLLPSLSPLSQDHVTITTTVTATTPCRK